MPELPEVETIKRILEKELVGKVFSTPILYVEKALQTAKEDFSSLNGKKILSLSREGKYLLIHLSEGRYLLFHLRMEGKLYIVQKETKSEKHLSAFFPFKDEEKGLAFYDTRKFGIIEYLHEKEKGPLSRIGKEPFDIHQDELYEKYSHSHRVLKELLLDQNLMSGIGNIYANEILFDAKLSPFLPGCSLSEEQCASLLISSRKILSLAIEKNGSTIRSYHAKEGQSGDFQNLLKVYSRKGQPCEICHHKIEKRNVAQRGTEYCPYCQKTGLDVAITGKIASGKSLAASYFREEGFLSFSADEEIHKMYHDPSFLKELKHLFPTLFTPTLDKKVITEKLKNDRAFKKKYLSFLYKRLRKKINDFTIQNNGKNKIFEMPVLFDAKMDDLFPIIIGVETKKQKEHLLERGEDPSRVFFNSMNSYDDHKDRLDYILHTDGEKSELKKQVLDVIKKITKPLF